VIGRNLEAVSNTVSVIIPSYNRGATIAAAIESALSQTLSPLEIIVVDDQSSDGTAQLVAGLPDQRIRLIVQPINAGGGAARNAGILAAKGEWLAFLDSDDLWQPSKLEVQLAAIAHHQDAICFTNLEFFGGNAGRKYWNKRTPRLGEKMSDYMIVSGQTAQTSTLFMKTAVARNIMFDPTLRRHQDWDFILRAEQAGVQFVYIEKALALYRLADADSVSRSSGLEATHVWLAGAGGLLDQRARTAVALDIILPRIAQNQPFKAAGYICRAALQFNASPRRLARAARDLVRACRRSGREKMA
jgi:glycosyltransferase involved in cell wall biosynthesis